MGETPLTIKVLHYVKHNEKGVITIRPKVPQICENVHRQVCAQLGIYPLTAQMFGLWDPRHKSWLPSTTTIPQPNIHSVQYEFRARIYVNTEFLVKMQYDAFKFLYYQVKDDFINERVDVFQKGNFSTALGNAILDIKSDIEDGLELKTSDYKKYIPKKAKQGKFDMAVNTAVSKQLKVMDEMDIKKDSQSLKQCYVQSVFQQVAEDEGSYFTEIYEVVEGVSLSKKKVFLQIFPYENNQRGLRVSGDKKTWSLVCGFNEMSSISLSAIRITDEEDENVISLHRDNGVMITYKFQNKHKMHSFVSGLDLYFRLTTCWTRHLCPEAPIESNEVKALWKLRIHGPVGKAFARKKLGNVKGQKMWRYMLRQTTADYGVYCFEIFLEEDKIACYRIDWGEDGQFSMTLNEETKSSGNIHELLHYFQKYGYRLGQLVHPSERDFGWNMLCRGEREAEMINPAAVSASCITMNVSPFTGGKGTYTVKGEFADRDEIRTVAVKAYRDPSWSVNDIRFSVSRHMFIQNELLVPMFGMMIPDDPFADRTVIGLVSAWYEKTLDVYLQEYEDLTEEQLVSAASQIADAVEYLMLEVHVKHGQIRCKKVVVVAEGEHMIKVKLSHPGLPHEGDQDAAWIPVEYHDNPTNAINYWTTDLWALATTCHEVLSRRADLSVYCNAKNRYAQFKEDWFDRPFFCSNEIFEVMRSCWKNDPKKRPSVRELSGVLQRKQIWFLETAREASGNWTSGESTTFILPDTPENKKREVNPLVLAGFEGITSGTEKEEPSSLEGLAMYSDSELIINQDEIKQEMDSNGRPIMLGKGNYGTVCKATWSTKLKSDKTVAVKKLNESCDEVNTNDFIQEFRIMKALNHPNVVTIEGFVQVSKTSMWIVMEYLSSGTVKQYLENFNEKRAQLTPRIRYQLLAFASDVAEGMIYLESQNVLHRDLAARNVLLHRTSFDRPVVAKITDFGLAHFIDKGYYKIQSKKGLPFCLNPPEALKYARFSFKSDVWAYGIFLWELFTFGGNPVLKDSSDKEGKPSNKKMLQLLEKGHRLTKPKYDECNIYGRLILECWNFKEEDRPTFEEAKKIVKQIEREKREEEKIKMEEWKRAQQADKKKRNVQRQE